MRARSCADLDELRSAYVDGALGDVDRERLLTHLVDCAACRRDVAELRHVRALLTGTADPALAPGDLSSRLVSIAGAEAAEPLWTRPFRRTAGSGRLPSERHRRHTRLLAGVLGCGLAVLTVLGVGYASAPAPQLAAVDPARQAVAEFTAVVSGFPLDSRVSAALQGLRPAGTGGPAAASPLSATARTLSAAKAAKLLVRAGKAGDELTYTGTQVVTLIRDGERLDNAVRVVNRGGAGTELQPDHGGQQTTGTLTTLHVEADSSTRMADADLIERLAERYTLRGWKDQWYAGRQAVVVEAVEPAAPPVDGSLDGVVARWWVDTETSLLLGQETFAHGTVVTSSRLVDLAVGPVRDEPRVSADSQVQTTAVLTLSHTATLRRQGWVCADRLAGLPLLRLRTDQTADADLVHLVYSDGLTSVSVVERRGRLVEEPDRATRNETLGAWVTDGLPSTATWTSGDVVLTAVTDGSRETLAAAVAALPHEPLQSPTTMERVRAGWSRILGR